ncbi:MAG: dihydrofolate reductase [Bacteroidota bacterium]|jgi:dihydrofolate reductase
MSKINIIVAASNNLVIGKNNDLPWNLPTDLKRFKELTQNGYVIMGRKCWESIPAKFRPLPNRKNVVVTRNDNFAENGTIVINNLTDTLKYIKDEPLDNKYFVIGGSQIYKEAFKFADKLYFTRILEDIEGDVYLEGFNKNEWSLLETSDTIKENNLTYRFDVYEKKV